MSARVIIQVPTTKELKLAAENTAKKQGLSSLQEAMRLFLTKFVDGQISISLSEKKEPPYGSEAWWDWADKEGLKELRAGKGKKFKTAEEAMKWLNS